MSLRRTASAAMLVLALLGTTLALGTGTAVSASPGSSGPAAGQAVYWNLGHPEVKPQRIFTAASSAPYLDKLKWKHWGKRKAVAKGIWVSECGYCYPSARYRATVRMSGFVRCKKDRTLRTYRRAYATVHTPDDHGHPTTRVNLFGGCY